MGFPVYLLNSNFLVCAMLLFVEPLLTVSVQMKLQIPSFDLGPSELLNYGFMFFSFFFGDEGNRSVI